MSCLYTFESVALEIGGEYFIVFITPVDGFLMHNTVTVLLSTMLFGIVTIQTYIYFSNFPLDNWKLKAFVR